jgi:hypothetical protein
MSDDPTSAQTQVAPTLVIPTAAKQTYPDIVELILHSESMNDEERQYWFDLLMDMNEDQITPLRGILTTERDELATIDAKFVKDAEQKAAAPENTVSMEERQKRSKERLEKESQEHEQEQAAADATLKEIQ